MSTNRFDELLGLLLDDDVTEQQLNELTQIVSQDTKKLDLLRDHLLMSDRLSQFEDDLRSGDRFLDAWQTRLHAADDTSGFVAKVVASAQEEASARSTHTLAKNENVWQIPKAAGTIAFALSLLILAAVLYQRTTDPDADSTRIALSPDTVVTNVGREEPSDLGVAVLTRASALVGEQTSDWATGKTVPPGVLTWDSGLLQLEFYAGATVVAEGPAEMEILDESHVICRSGRLRVHVPKPARGFSVLAPSIELVDLGTEFGLDVLQNGDAEVHVFDGKVELYDAETNRDIETRRVLNAGDALTVNHDGTSTPIDLRDADFVSPSLLNQIADGRQKKQLSDWRTFRDAMQDDPRVVAYFPFDRNDVEDRILSGYGANGSTLEGAIVGCEWTEGRWPDKSSLQFKRPGDRVRITVPGEYQSLTYSIWLRVDGLDRKYNSLLLTDGFGRNRPHWQIRQDGSLALGMRHSSTVLHSYRTASIFNLFRLGQWVHLAMSYDAVRRDISHYVNGKLAMREPLEEAASGLLKIGDATIGNWSAPTHRHRETRVRNLNGCIDELIVFGEALGESEIRRICEAGRP
ncbi:LamG-like jellyroll fold domain-containing protein [Rhodopirellula sallentina]|uniref:FecR protein domain protein n=1 Tax=Rhodopirellula sallentina SM41 TaxID=1263870 RepID=M5UMM0_9BACT|nr:LamG-like jellyroll fold domain-containing protein [Rhodopirellula sallentina]EMI57238.1 FecR protein domain protein [Rhodopirellula sallentina SM41]